MANKNENNLTLNQQKFADYYLANGCNATQAYADTYPKASIATAQQNGCKLLKQRYVHDYITKRQLERNQLKALATNKIIQSETSYRFIL